MNLLETFYVLIQTSAKQASAEVKGAAEGMAHDLEAADARIAAADAARTAKELANVARVRQAEATLLAQGHDLTAAKNAQARADDAAAASKLANARQVIAASRAEEHALEEVTEEMRRAEAAGASFGKGLVAIGARLFVLFGGAFAAQKLIGSADEYTNIQNRLKLATTSTEEFAAAQEKLFGVAQRSRQSWTATVDLYASLQRSTKTLGVSQEDLLGVTETINQALIVSGSSAEAANAALIQLGQGMSSGVLRGEELNSVLEQAPRLAKAIADGMGVQVGQLRELGAKGKITGAMVFKALQSQSAAIRAEFEKTTPTVKGAYQTMQNSTVKFVGEMDKAWGVSAALAEALTDVADALTPLGTFLRDHQDLLKGFALGIIAVAGAIGVAQFAAFTATPAFAQLAVAVNAALWPFLAIAAAIALFAIAFEDVSAYLKGQPSLLGDLAKKYGWVRDAIDFVSKAFKWLKDVATDVWDFLGKVAKWGAEQWETWGPLIMAIVGFIGLLLRIIWRIGAVFAEVFGTLMGIAQPVLDLLVKAWNDIIDKIKGPWDAMFKWFGDKIKWLANALTIVTKAGNASLDAGALGGGPNPTQRGLTAGRQQLAAARTAPATAQTSNSVRAARGGGNRTSTVAIEKVEVHTQATDAEGISKAIGGGLKTELRQVTAQHDDGVDR